MMTCFAKDVLDSFKDFAMNVGSEMAVDAASAPTAPRLGSGLIVARAGDCILGDSDELGKKHSLRRLHTRSANIALGTVTDISCNVTVQMRTSSD